MSVPFTAGKRYDVWLTHEAADAVRDAGMPRTLIFEDTLGGYHILRELDRVGDAGVREGRRWNIAQAWVVLMPEAEP